MTLDITYKENIELQPETVKNLYQDAGWTIYLKDLDKLMNAIENSLYTITAWEDGKLIGLARVVGDGFSIVYIQDILILHSHRRKGIGTKMVKMILEKYKYVRQTVLLTDETESTRKFYENLDFFSCDNGKIVAFAKFNQ